METLEDQPCPGCGQWFGVHWIDSAPTTDTWSCKWCRHEWTIAVEVLVPSPRAAAAC